MPKLTRREFLKLSGQALAATSTACAFSGLLRPRSAQADTPPEFDGGEMVTRLGDTFATIQMVPRFSRDATPSRVEVKVQYSTDPTFASYLASAPVTSELLYRPEKGVHAGTNGTNALVPNRKKRLQTWGVQPGDLIENKTDGSVMEVTEVTAGSIVGTLFGGERNCWNLHDKWRFDRYYYHVSVPLTDLTPDTRYYYRVSARSRGQSDWPPARPAHSFHTRRPPGQSFRFALIADCHRVQPNEMPNGSHWAEWHTLLASLRNEGADFLVDIGDTWLPCNGSGKPHSKRFLDLYGYAMRPTRSGYQSYSGLDAACGDMGYFLCRGNHEGIIDYQGLKMKGNTTELLKIFAPNPDGTTYPEGGSTDADYNQGYFAFEWGDALFIVLDVVKYKESPKSEHTPARFHIGQEQLSWLTSVLEGSTARWKFLFTHHIFGGAISYGRGGAAFAHQYEQAQIQALCEQHGAHVFYGHDHLLASMFANGVLYHCCGCSWGGQFDYRWADKCYPDGFISTSCNSVPPACENNGYTVVDVSPSQVTISYKRYADGSTLLETVLT